MSSLASNTTFSDLFFLVLQFPLLQHPLPSLHPELNVFLFIEKRGRDSMQLVCRMHEHAALFGVIDQNDSLTPTWC